MRRWKFVLLVPAVFAVAVAFVGAVTAQARTAVQLAEAVPALHRILDSGGEGIALAADQPAFLVTGAGEFMALAVPAHWRETNSGTWRQTGSADGAFVEAAPNLAAFRAGTGPGVFFGMTPAVNPPAPGVLEQPVAAARAQSAQALAADAERSAACQQEEPRPYSDPFYTGVYTVATGCAPDPALQHVTLSATPLLRDYSVTLRAITATAEDRAALAQILQSFQVLNPTLRDIHDEEAAGHIH